MYGRETRVLLRHYLEQGVPKAELARRLGVSRRTIYHWIANGDLDRELIERPFATVGFAGEIFGFAHHASFA